MACKNRVHAFINHFFIIILFSPAINASTYNVDSFSDSADAMPGDGVCASLTGGCTLRAALQEANSAPSNDTINLPAGTYILSIKGSDEDQGATGDLDIFGSGDVIIQGDSLKTTIIDANKSVMQDRIFHILRTAGKVIFNDFTAHNAWLYYGNGAGIYNLGEDTILNNVEISDNNAITFFNSSESPARTEYGVGGGIFNSGSMTLDNSSVIYNLSGNREFWDYASQTISGGGGIRNTGFLEIRNNSHIDYNQAKTGGGIKNTGVMEVTDSSVMSNSTSSGYGSGGGIANHGIMLLRRVYVGDNNCLSCDGGGISNTQAGPQNAVAVILESAVDNNSALLSIGGGISNMASMYINYSSISWNASAGLGSGISNIALGDLTIENSTIVGNSYRALGAYGAGIHNAAKLSLNHVTLTGNFAGGIFAEDLFINTLQFDVNDPRDWVTISNTIIGDEAYNRKLFTHPAGLATMDAYPDNFCGGGYSTNTEIPVNGGIPSGQNISTQDYVGLIKSLGYNLSNGSTCVLGAEGDQASIAPNLMDAGAYGGATLSPGPYLPNPITRPPTNLSPALDIIPETNCDSNFDQRLFGRASGIACDVGAAEAGNLAKPHADLVLTASSEPSKKVATGQILVYTVTVNNSGPFITDGINVSVFTEGAASNTLTLLDATFVAPNNIGQVTCTAKTSGNQVASCTFDTPLASGAELIVYLSMTITGSGHIDTSAEVFAGTTPDLFEYNNKAEISYEIEGAVTVEVVRPATSSSNVQSGSIGLIEIMFFMSLSMLFGYFRFSACKRPVILGMSGLILALFSVQSFAVAPTFTSVSPLTGSSTSDTFITITGTGFSDATTIGLLNDPTVSSVVSRVTPTNAFFVERQNDLLYLGLDNGLNLSVYDVSIPEAPVALIQNMKAYVPRGPGGQNASSGGIVGIAARQDDMLFLPLSNTASLVVYDFSTPSNPKLIRRFPKLTRTDGLHPDTSEITYTDIDGDILYMTKGRGGSITPFNQPGLYIVDTTKITGASILSFVPLYPSGQNRTKVVTIPTSSGIKKYLLLAGLRASVKIANVATEGELIIFDVTDPSNPVAVLAMNGPPTVNGSIAGIEDIDIVTRVEGPVTKMYVVASVYNFTGLTSIGGLYVYDLGPDTGFTNTTPIGSYLGLSGFRKISIDGNIATAIDENVLIRKYYDFDLTDMTAPKLVGGPYTNGAGQNYYPWRFQSSAGHIYASGGFIYKRNPVITINSVTPTSITAVIPAGFIPQLYDFVITNSLGESEEVIRVDAFTIE